MFWFAVMHDTQLQSDVLTQPGISIFELRSNFAGAM